MLKNKQTNKKPNTNYPNFAGNWSFSFWRERCPLVWWVHLPLQSSERYHCPTWGKGFSNNLPDFFFLSERGPLITDYVISSVLTSQEIMLFFLPFVKIFFCHPALTPNFSHPSELTSVKKNPDSFLPSVSCTRNSLLLLLLQMGGRFLPSPTHYFTLDMHSIFSESLYNYSD